MANILETAIWEAVYQLATNDPVLGGTDGASNKPIKNLANRTAWLKAQLESTNADILALAGAVDDAIAHEAAIRAANDATEADTRWSQDQWLYGLIQNLLNKTGNVGNIDLQTQINNLQSQLNSFLNAEGNGSYSVGTYNIKVYPGATKTITLWGGGGSGGGSRNDGNWGGTDGNNGSDTRIVELGIVAGGGGHGVGGSWGNGSAYSNGSGGSGGIAANANNSDINGNAGTATRTDQSGGGSLQFGHGAGGNGRAGMGDDGWSFGGGGGSGAWCRHVYTNTTSSVVTLTLIVGAGAAVGSYGGSAGGDGYATVSS